MRIDLITSLYLGVVVFISIPLAQSKCVLYAVIVLNMIFFLSFLFMSFSALDAGVIGLALAYTISLAGILQFCVRQSAEVENIVSTN